MRKQRWAMLTAGALVAAGSLALAPAASTSAAPQHFKRSEDPRLGNGLGRTGPAGSHPERAQEERARSAQRPDAASAITDAQGRVMVDLTPQQGVDRAAFRANAESLGLKVKAVDADHGTLEGYVPLGSVKQLASLKGTGTIAQAVRPHTMVGAATSQGVALERADKVQQAGHRRQGHHHRRDLRLLRHRELRRPRQQAQGPRQAGHQVRRPARARATRRTPSRSRCSRTGPTRTSTRTRAGRCCRSSTTSRRPRSSASPPPTTARSASPTTSARWPPRPGRARPTSSSTTSSTSTSRSSATASVGDAVDDVTAQGVQYFSAAGNQGIQQTWDSPVRLIPAAQGIKGTNLDFSDVDPTLYNGGLQDMNPGAGTDVAQDLLVGAVRHRRRPVGRPVRPRRDQARSLALQREGHADRRGSGEELQGHRTRVDGGQAGAGDAPTVSRPATSTSSSSITDPDGNVVADEIDNDTSPEIYAATIKKAGTYTVTVGGFAGETGPFTLDVSPIVTPSKTTTDFNLLFFSEDGEFLGATDRGEPAHRASERDRSTSRARARCRW